MSQVDLPLAKQIIDTLGMLQEKTKGNLDPDEDNLLEVGALRFASAVCSEKQKVR